MRSREDFIKRWKTMIAGLAICGAVSEARDGPLVRAAKILDIPDTVERVLGQMYDDLARSREQADPVTPPPRKVGV